MDRRADPKDAAEIWQAKRSIAIEEFQAGRMSEDVFTATLFGLGYIGERLRIEVSLARPALKTQCADRKTHDQSTRN